MTVPFLEVEQFTKRNTYREYLADGSGMVSRYGELIPHREWMCDTEFGCACWCAACEECDEEESSDGAA